jgi:predicted transcriptional regulator
MDTVEANILAGPRRSKMEVKIDILQAISEGAGRPTHIMYRSNLSWAVMRNFIKALEDQGLVSSSDVEGRKNYILTQKGTRVLDTYANVRKQLVTPQLIAPLA